MHRRRLTAVCAVLAISAGLLAGCSEERDRERGDCEAVSADFDWAQPSRSDDARFEVSGPGWIGGDSTYSVQLPQDRTLWLFSDSLIGTVDDGGNPEPGMTMVHNALVVEDGSGQLSTLTREGPESFFPDPGEKTYYWVQDAKVEGGELLVLLSRTKQVGEHGFEWERNTLARVSLPELEVTEIQEGFDGPVAWGAGLMTTAQHTWIYGIEDREKAKHLHVARAPAGSLADRSTWEYLGADGWEDEPDESERLTTGVANELSVSPFRDGYLMISSDTSEPYSPKINAWTSCSPTGPWEQPQTIYETPETQGQHFTYNAHGHPELSQDGRLLISYNVNTFDFDELMNNPTLYRPKFISLDLP